MDTVQCWQDTSWWKIIRRNQVRSTREAWSCEEKFFNCFHKCFVVQVITKPLEKFSQEPMMAHQTVSSRRNWVWVGQIDWWRQTQSWWLDNLDGNKRGAHKAGLMCQQSRSSSLQTHLVYLLHRVRCKTHLGWDTLHSFDCFKMKSGRFQEKPDDGRKKNDGALVWLPLKFQGRRGSGGGTGPSRQR